MSSSQPINLLIGVILGYISPKAFPKDCAIYSGHKWPKFFIYPPGEISFLVSLLMSIQSIVFVSGRISPHNFGIFSISPLQAFSFRWWFSNNSVITFLEGCFPNSLVVQVGIFFSILLYDLSSILSPGGIVMFLFSLIISNGVDRVLFVLSI